MKKQSVIVIFAAICLCLCVMENFRLEGMETSESSFQPSDELALEEFAAAAKYKENLESWLRTCRDPEVVPAAVAAVVKNNRILFTAGANADQDTVFGIASLSKTFTAVLLLQLYEEGVLDIDQPLVRYLPEIQIERKETGSVPVTLRHLMAHTSGIPTFGEMNQYRLANGETICLSKQVYPAGACYCYSNSGYVVLKMVIEHVTGRKYFDLMNERVFIPLGMNSSTAEWANGTGGIQSTLKDLNRYIQMLMDCGVYKKHRLISEKSFTAMMQPGIERPGSKEDYYYSLGWEVETRDGRINSFYKAGRWYGEGSAIQVFPSERIAILYLCNPPYHRSKEFMGWRSRLSGRLRSIAEKFSGKDDMLIPWPLKEYSESKRYCGRYIDKKNGNSIVISQKKGHLFARRNGIERILRPFSSVRYFEGNGNILYGFAWKDSQISGLSVRKHYYEKISSLFP